MRNKRGNDARGWRRGAGWLALSCALVLTVLAPVVLAQSTNGTEEIDVEPPLIEHERVESGEPGAAQEFTATVVDDRGIAEVRLFHRFAGEEMYRNVPMQRLAASSTFAASVPTDADDDRAIEYYIQARDEAGNRVIKGYAFSPLVREMGGEGAGVARVPDERPETSSGSGRRWLLVGLGVLAAGAAAVALSDTSDDPSDSDVFTVTIDPPR